MRKEKNVEPCTISDHYRPLPQRVFCRIFLNEHYKNIRAMQSVQNDRDKTLQKLTIR